MVSATSTRSAAISKSASGRRRFSRRISRWRGSDGAGAAPPSALISSRFRVVNASRTRGATSPPTGYSTSPEPAVRPSRTASSRTRARFSSSDRVPRAAAGCGASLGNAERLHQRSDPVGACIECQVGRHALLAVRDPARRRNARGAARPGDLERPGRAFEERTERATRHLQRARVGADLARDLGAGGARALQRQPRRVEAPAHGLPALSGHAPAQVARLERSLRRRHDLPRRARPARAAARGCRPWCPRTPPDASRAAAVRWRPRRRRAVPQARVAACVRRSRACLLRGFLPPPPDPARRRRDRRRGLRPSGRAASPGRPASSPTAALTSASAPAATPSSRSMSASAAGLSVVGAAERNGSRSTRSPATSIAKRARGALQATRALPDRVLFPSVSARSVTAASAAVTPTRPRPSSRPASCAATPSAASSALASSAVTWTSASSRAPSGATFPSTAARAPDHPSVPVQGNRGPGRLESGEGCGAQIEIDRVARDRGGSARGRRSRVTAARRRSPRPRNAPAQRPGRDRCPRSSRCGAARSRRT